MCLILLFHHVVIELSDDEVDAEGIGSCGFACTTIPHRCDFAFGKVFGFCVKQLANHIGLWLNDFASAREVIKQSVEIRFAKEPKALYCAVVKSVQVCIVSAFCIAHRFLLRFLVSEFYFCKIQFLSCDFKLVFKVVVSGVDGFVFNAFLSEVFNEGDVFRVGVGKGFGEAD